jgi:hypothetical protein
MKIAMASITMLVCSGAHDRTVECIAYPSDSGSMRISDAGGSGDSLRASASSRRRS